MCPHDTCTGNHLRDPVGQALVRVVVGIQVLGDQACPPLRRRAGGGRGTAWLRSNSFNDLDIRARDCYRGPVGQFCFQNTHQCAGADDGELRGQPGDGRQLAEVGFADNADGCPERQVAFVVGRGPRLPLWMRRGER